MLYVIFVFYKEDRVGYLESQHTQFQLSTDRHVFLPKIKNLNKNLNQKIKNLLAVTKQFKPGSRPMLNTFPSCKLKDHLAKELDWKS